MKKMSYSCILLVVHEKDVIQLYFKRIKDKYLHREKVSIFYYRYISRIDYYCVKIPKLWASDIQNALLSIVCKRNTVL